MMWTVLDDQKPTARKQHRCSTCWRIIEPGEAYRRLRVITDDGPDVYKECVQCGAVVSTIYRCDPDVQYWDDGVDLGEYLREYRCDPLRSAFEQQWRNVGVDDLPLSCLPNWHERAAALPESPEDRNDL